MSGQPATPIDTISESDPASAALEETDNDL
jgi:hypothetical protein